MMAQMYPKNSLLHREFLGKADGYTVAVAFLEQDLA
jgi:hypothetical protein